MELHWDPNQSEWSAMWLITFSVLILAASDLGVAASRANAPAGLDFRAGFAIEENGIWATEIYTRRAESGVSEWVARRSLMTSAGPEQVRWTSGSSCPVLEDVASSLNHFPLGGLVMPDLNRTGPRHFVYPAPGRLVHGAAVTIWATGMSGDGFVDYRLQAQSGNVADWAHQASETLGPCWEHR